MTLNDAMIEKIKATGGENKTGLYLGMSLIGGFLLMVILDQGFMILRERVFTDDPLPEHIDDHYVNLENQ